MYRGDRDLMIHESTKLWGSLHYLSLVTPLVTPKCATRKSSKRWHCWHADISFHRLIKKGYIAKIPFFIFFVLLLEINGCMAAWLQSRPLSDNNPRLFSNNPPLFLNNPGLFVFLVRPVELRVRTLRTASSLTKVKVWRCNRSRRTESVCTSDESKTSLISFFSTAD